MADNDMENTILLLLGSKRLEPVVGLLHPFESFMEIFRVQLVRLIFVLGRIVVLYAHQLIFFLFLELQMGQRIACNIGKGLPLAHAVVYVYFSDF